jgi:hypothetical protein
LLERKWNVIRLRASARLLELGLSGFPAYRELATNAQAF